MKLLLKEKCENRKIRTVPFQNSGTVKPKGPGKKQKSVENWKR